MFKTSKKKIEEHDITNYVSLFLNPSEQILYFDPFFTLAKECNVKVTNMTFYSNEFWGTERHHIQFAITGSQKNLRNFHKKCPNLKHMDVFNQIY